ncbi:MAG: PSD1 and planctomycete cytochrome C domain-containing protein [Verrucomicrobiota bacterium]
MKSQSSALKLLLFAALASPAALHAQESIPAEQLDYFENHVRPALVKYCYECHSVDSGESRGGLYLDTRDGMREGGSTGPLFEGDYPLFIDAITWADPDFEMPPKQKMPDDVIEHLKNWVEMGAPDPRERETFHVETEIDIEAGKDHWAYQRPARSAARSIDEIVTKKRTAEGLKAVDPADSLTLLRRLTFDLTGLPPTPPEVKAFHEAYKKNAEAAITEKIDQLLDSPHYGERWGRHWLDVVRYGESSGTLNIIYPYAWRFRNYVIDSFNEDKPYDRLLTEHLAGDLLPASNDEERQKLLIATGYLALGPKKQNEKDRRAFAMNLIDEQIDTTTRGFMATTVACARCHDHKFDPIATTDYYAMAGIFQSTDTLWGTIAGNQNHRTTELLELPIPDKGLSSEDQREAYEAKKQRLAELIQKNKELRSMVGGKGGGKGKGRRAQGDQNQGNTPGGETKSREELLAEMGMNGRSLVALKQQIMRAQSELKFLNPDGSAKTFGMGAREGNIGDSNVLVTGDVNKPAQMVERGFPEVLHFQGTPEIPGNASGRLQLAEWIASPNNPLTARVMVNRIWMHLTGKPIVETMDNFGMTGLPPSNPELLDHLAVRFMENNWSIKQLVRDITLSDTYQLASTFNEANYAVDPDNKTHWRANPRQLDAESLRDQMLVVSGLLDRERPETSMTHELGDSRLTNRGRDAVQSLDTAQFRGRSLYLPILREALPDELGLFDFPDPMGTIGQRSPTNVAPQSLHLMNSDLVQHQSHSMAKLLERNFSSPREQVSNAFLLSYSRPATDDEIARGLQFIRDFEPGDPPATEPLASSLPYGRQGPAMTSNDGDNSEPGRGARKKGGPRGKSSTPRPAPPEQTQPPITEDQAKLAAFCQALMMSAEFRMIH